MSASKEPRTGRGCRLLAAWHLATGSRRAWTNDDVGFSNVTAPCPGTNDAAGPLAGGEDQRGAVRFPRAGQALS